MLVCLLIGVLGRVHSSGRIGGRIGCVRIVQEGEVIKCCAGKMIIKVSGDTTKETEKREASEYPKK